MTALRRLLLALLLRLTGRLPEPRLLLSGLRAFLPGRLPRVLPAPVRPGTALLLPLSSMPHLLSGIIITYFHYTSLIIYLFQEILNTA